MSLVRQQAHIEAPVETIWELVGDPNRHPEWWPGMVEVECEGLEEGCDYRAVVKGPFRDENHEVHVDTLDSCKEVTIRCTENGTFMRWVLTDAQEGTFLDVEFGMEPVEMRYRVFDVLAGKRYFRRWLEQSLAGLRAASAASAAGKTENR